jgi:hypothetical protein
MATPAQIEVYPKVLTPSKWIPQELHLRGDALTDNKPTIGRGHDPGHLTFQCRLTLLLL